MKTINLLTALILITLTACGQNKNDTAVKTSKKQDFNTELGIEAVPKSLGKQYTRHFVKYTKVTAPNGKPIHIVIQDQITDEQAASG